MVAITAETNNVRIPRNHGIQASILMSNEPVSWLKTAAAIPTACIRRKVLLRSCSETVSATMVANIVFIKAGPPSTTSKQAPKKTNRIDTCGENQKTRKLHSSSRKRPKRPSVRTTVRPYRSARILYGMAERESDRKRKLRRIEYGKRCITWNYAQQPFHAYQIGQLLLYIRFFADVVVKYDVPSI